ncbi:MAG: hypothetical protein ABIA47_03060 [bacterium]
MQIFAVLGSHPELSIAEIEAVTGAKPTYSNNEVAVFDDVDLELTKLQARLGGTQKVGFVIGSLPATIIPSEPKANRGISRLPLVARDDKEELVSFLASQLTEIVPDGKINFGISAYDDKLSKTTNSLGLEIKKTLKESGKSARFVTSKEPTLSSVVVKKNHLLDRGAEFVLLIINNEIVIGQTAAVQDFEDWSHRDYDRPARDPKRGMLPPKLARIMINLSGIDPANATLLDPFCGSGTVPMEAAMVGFDNLIGGDSSESAIEDTRENLEWLKSEGYDVPSFELINSKAVDLVDLEVDAIITEPYLGKPRTGKESIATVKKMVSEIEALYRDSFSTLADLLKPGGKFVLAIPVHFVDGDQIKPQVDKIFPPDKFKIIGQPTLYKQKGQYIGREITKIRLK